MYLVNKVLFKSSRVRFSSSFPSGCHWFDHLYIHYDSQPKETLFHFYKVRQDFFQVSQSVSENLVSSSNLLVIFLVCSKQDKVEGFTPTYLAPHSIQHRAFWKVKAPREQSQHQFFFGAAASIGQQIPRPAGGLSVRWAVVSPLMGLWNSPTGTDLTSSTF